MVVRSKTKQNPNNKTLLYCFLLLSVIIFLLYGRTIKHEYAIDDDLVTQNHSIVQKGISAIPEIFTSYYFIDKKMQFGYRPIVIVSFAIEHQFFGQDPHVSHFINILLYILNCFLVFLILRKLFSQNKFLFPLLVTLLFVFHPIHTEVVCSIKSRDELLSFAFSLFALWLAFKFADTSKKYLLPIITLVFVLAIFSKQTAYTFLAVIPLSLFYYQKKFERKVQIMLFITLLTGIIIASLPRFLLPPVHREIFFFENPLVTAGSLVNRLCTALYIIPFYLKLLIFPHPLVFYYGYNMIPIPKITDPIVIISFIFSSFLIVFAFIKMLKYPIISFAILFFFITLSLFLNIVEPVAGIVAERFIYFASLGFCLAVGLALFKVLKIKPDAQQTSPKKITQLALASLILILPYSVKTFTRANDWENYSTLYAKDVKYLENSALANAIYAEMLINEIFTDISNNRQPTDYDNKLKLAVKHYQQSIRVYDAYFSSYNNLAFIYYQFYKEYSKAIPYLQKAIALRPDYTEAYFNLGYCHQMLGNLKEAEKHYSDALATDSNFTQAYSNLGEVYLQMKDFSKAVDMNKKIMKIAPESDLAYINLGKIYLTQGDTLQSMSNFEIAAEKSPNNINLLRNLAAFYERKGNKEKSVYYNSLIEKQNRNK